VIASGERVTPVFATHVVVVTEIDAILRIVRASRHRIAYIFGAHVIIVTTYGTDIHVVARTVDAAKAGSARVNVFYTVTVVYAESARRRRRRGRRK
jgi:hypothetical protein